MGRIIKRNMFFFGLYVLIFLSASVLFSNFFSENLVVYYYQPFFSDSIKQFNIQYLGTDSLDSAKIRQVVSSADKTNYFVNFGSYSANINLIGTEMTEEWFKLPLYKGRWFSDSIEREAVIGKGVAPLLKNKDGSATEITFLDETYQVVGVIDDIGQTDYFSKDIILNINSLYQQQKLPLNSTDFVIFGETKEVEQLGKRLEEELSITDQVIISPNELIEFPRYEEMNIMDSESLKVFWELLAIILLTVIITAKNYMSHLTKEVGLKKILVIPYVTIIFSFSKQLICFIFTAALLSYILHLGLYKLMSFFVLKKPYSQVSIVFSLIAIGIYCVQICYLSVLFYRKSAHTFFKEVK